MFDEGAITLRDEIHDFLRSAIADEGTSIDRGAGMGMADLCVTVDGVSYSINIKPLGRFED